ncbi:Cell division protein FtsA [Candidatus Magnetomoraceae bacterium gMMP-13]
MHELEELIVGLDIGTTKICAVVGEVTQEGIHIIGIGSHPSIGLRKGVIVNIESTVDSIKKAVENAEMMAGCEISNIYAGIAGGHIKGFNSHGIIAIKGSEITQQDVNRVIDAARAVKIPMDQEIIHILPQEYIVDSQPGIHNPIGMAGIRLEVKIHIVIGAVSSIHNIIKCADRAGLDVNDIILESLASGQAVLSPEEMELGAALLDIGGGTTDMAIFHGKHVKHTSILPLGGINLTNDIAIGLRAPLSEARQIKEAYGSCLGYSINSNETIKIPGIGGSLIREVPRQILSEILGPRVEEIFSLVNQDIHKSFMEKMIVSGIVLTGGTSLLNGIDKMAEYVLGYPVRIGSPLGIKGLTDVVNNPIHATGVGLVLHGAQNQPSKKFRLKDKNLLSRLINRMKGWFKEII